jgi:hypothetical protein
MLDSVAAKGNRVASRLGQQHAVLPIPTIRLARMSISVTRKIQYCSDGADNPDNPVAVSLTLDSER